jgi:putative ABC transport system permease protein
MFKNYFTVAWRNIRKHRIYSLVNIIGLSTGIAFAFLIGGYVWNELQVNKYIRNRDRQYIIQSIWKDPNQGFDLATIGPLAKALRQQYPNLVANYYRWDEITSNVSKGDKHFREGLQIGDSSFLPMYGFSLLHGNAQTALNNPFSLVITESIAIKYFGKTDVLGQTLSIESFSGTTHDFIITGVLKHSPENIILHLHSGYRAEFYLSESSLNFFGRNMETWANLYIVSCIELQKGVESKDLVKPMQKLIKDNASAQVSESLTPRLVLLKDYYLNSNNGLVKKMLYTLSCIALFILLMAIVNFINISISKSATRIREIGVRKVMGGLRQQLLQQFLMESVILVSFATGFALIIYEFTRNFFSSLLGKEIPSLSAFPLYFVFCPIVIALVVGLLAGIYPAFVLSSLKAVDSIKGKLASVKENILLRKSLVGFQFCIATIVFIGAIIISQQVSLFFSKDLGYNRDYIVSAKVPRDWTPAGVQHIEALRKEFADMPDVRNVTVSYEIPDGANAGSFQLYKFGGDSTRAITVQQLTTDEEYASAYQIPMRAGVFYKTAGEAVDSSKIVINETAAKSMGWIRAEEAVGKQLKISGAPFILTVAGVTKDFHFGSMQGNIPPMIFLHLKFGIVYRFLSFKIKPGNIGNSMAALQKKWSAIFPSAPFDYTFMDDDLKRIYLTEIQLKKASYAATILSFIIVLLGVIGLISLSVQKRTKEIGIRKVLGASIAGIMSLFMKEFLLVIIFAGIVACPVAYVIMKGWLNDYAYRISITAQPFLFATFGLGLITALIIIIQTIKAAAANPVNSLRTE